MKQPIPFFSLDRHVTRLQPQLSDTVHRVLASQQYVGGPYVEQLEKNLADYCGAAEAVACNSGTDALWLALKTLDVKPRDIIITTPFSFIASSSELIALGAQPAYVDIDEHTFNLSPSNVREWLVQHAIMRDGVAIHRQTKNPIPGMLVVNMFGQCADYENLRAIADEWNLWIIEDAAQSIGSSIGRYRSGCYGDIATFSFYPTKNLGACGDAGALVTNNDEYVHRARSLCNHGRHSHYQYLEYGINSRMDAVQAAVLSTKLPHLDGWNNQRRDIAAQYKSLLADTPHITLPREDIGTHTYHQYSILVTSSRDACKDYLTEHGIGTNIFYPCPLYDVSYIKNYTTLPFTCPVTEKVTQHILALPIWPELTREEVEYIARTLRTWAETSRHTSPAQTESYEQNR